MSLVSFFFLSIASASSTILTVTEDREYVDLSDGNPSWSELIRLWDVFNVTLEASVPIKVYWHGGTSWEPVALEGWNRKLCINPYRPSWSWFEHVKKCTVQVSRWGQWAPLGNGSRLIVQRVGGDEDTPWTLEYTAEPIMDKALTMVFGLGLLIYLLAPIAGHSRGIHLSTGALLGALGTVLIIIFVLSRLMPGNKGIAFFTIAVGSAISGLVHFWTPILVKVQENGFYFAIFVAVGAFVGFAISYKYPLDPTSQSLLTITLRLVAILFILSGTNNYFASLLVIILVLTRRLWLRVLRCLFCSSCLQDSEENADEEEDSSGVSYAEGGPFHDASAHTNGTKGLSRAARKRYLEKKMDPKQLEQFHVRGADEYITPKQYEQEAESYTEQALKELRAELHHGKYSNGAYVSKLSGVALQRMKSFLAPEDIDYQVND